VVGSCVVVHLDNYLLANLGNPTLRKILVVLRDHFGAEGATTSQWRDMAIANAVPKSTFGTHKGKAVEYGLAVDIRSPGSNRPRWIVSPETDIDLRFPIDLGEPLTLPKTVSN
jgi:hypothetical protein